MLVYVMNINGVPLMPSVRCGHIRKLLKEHKAKVVKRDPFTVQLLYDTDDAVQEVELKVDTGYQHVGVSACSDKAELYSAEVNLLSGQKQRLEDRRKYRRDRRNHLRYRKPRFNNRKVEEGWLAPSIQHKIDSHVKAVERVVKILPVSKIMLEVANFDIQKIKNPDVEGADYQHGEMYDFRNVREYIFFRDNYTCQICGKNAFKDGVSLHWHHIEFWKDNHSDAPANGLTVCTKCHCSKNHKPGSKLWGLTAKQKEFKAETFMATVRRLILAAVRDSFGVPVEATYGYLTKDKRITLGLEKTHFNDVYCIGNEQPSLRLASPVFFREKRKNNRSLSKFYDAKYIDGRDGSKKSGKELFSGRSTRNKNLSTENLHRYRSKKVSKGRFSLRTKRHPLQPYDIVAWQNRKWIVSGVQNNGAYIRIHDSITSKVVRIGDVKLINRAETVYVI